MEPLPPSPEQPPKFTEQAAKLLTDFVERQPPSTQAGIAKALAAVNDYLDRFRKKP